MDQLVFDSLFLAEKIATPDLVRDVFAFRSIDSTNNFAKSLARKRAAQGVLVLADEQTHGRGRAGKAWRSPAGKGLWFSLLLHPRTHFEKLGLLSLGAGLAVAQAVEQLYHLQASVKWPNDVLLHKKKFCGILLESEFSPQRLSYLVIGFGVNVNQDQIDLPPELAQNATSIKLQAGRVVDRLALLNAILRAFETVYGQFVRGAFDAIRRQWKNRSCFSAGKISIAVHGRTFTGTFSDIDEYGRLVLRLEDGTLRVFDSGTILAF